MGHAAIGTARGAGAGLGLLILLVIGGAFYFLPSIIASVRKVPNLGSVIVINIFLGWTFIGWIVALAMAMRSPLTPVQVHMYGGGVPMTPGVQQYPDGTAPGAALREPAESPDDRRWLVPGPQRAGPVALLRRQRLDRPHARLIKATGPQVGPHGVSRTRRQVWSRGRRS